MSPFIGHDGYVSSSSPDWADAGAWEDLRAPMTGAGLDTSTGRLSTDYTEACVVFASNARYPEEPAIMNFQLPHGYKQGSDLHPHLHWYQDVAGNPNWMIRWRFAAKGSAPTAWTNAIWSSILYSFVSTRIHQMTLFPAISAPTGTLSDMLQIILFRDTTNVSGLFSAPDPVAADVLTLEFDVHVLMETLGSPLISWKAP